jgi:hypothetical protein
MTAWKRMMDTAKRLTRGRRRGQPDALVAEKVSPRPGTSLRELYESPENPLRGVWGPDPDAWLDELRGQWQERQTS